MDICVDVGSFVLKEHDSLFQLQELAEIWNRLWSQCPQATPFQSPEWLIPWWKHFGEGELWVLALRQADRLVGIVPWFIQQNAVTGERTVLLLGTGITDYLDALFLPGFEREGAAAAIEHLKANARRWDRCDFQQLPGSSALLVVTAASEFTSEVAVQEVCPVLKLPSDTRELPAQVPTRMLEKLRYYRRRLEKTGPIRVEGVHPDNFEEFFDSFIRLHQARWLARKQEGGLRTPDLQAFHRESARKMLTKGALRLYALTFRDQIAATLYGFSHAGRTFYYLSGFNPKFAEFSPGTVMIGHAIEQAVCEGVAEFDFLRGRETYKYLWGAKGRLNFRRQFWHACAE